MKKFLTVLLILVMVFTFAACGNGGDQGDGGKEFLAGQLIAIRCFLRCFFCHDF